MIEKTTDMKFMLMGMEAEAHDVALKFGSISAMLLLSNLPPASEMKWKIRYRFFKKLNQFKSF